VSQSQGNDEPKITRTAHAMLVPWGLYARQISLVQRLETVPIAQRKRDYEPQTKLIEFLVAILSGCRYLQDISHGPHPLDRDQTVAAAWDQPGWADYSGVSRTLQACTEETVEAVRDVIEEVSRPFIDREVVLSLQQTGTLIYDGDLTARPVSSTSTTYPGAAFGWMDDAVRLGYQAALVSLHSPTYGRLWLSVTPHPGDTVSCSQADALECAVRIVPGHARVPGYLDLSISHPLFRSSCPVVRLARTGSSSSAQNRYIDVDSYCVITIIKVSVMEGNQSCDCRCRDARSSKRFLRGQELIGRIAFQPECPEVGPVLRRFGNDLLPVGKRAVGKRLIDELVRTFLFDAHGCGEIRKRRTEIVLCSGKLQLCFGEAVAGHAHIES